MDKYNCIDLQYLVSGPSYWSVQSDSVLLLHRALLKSVGLSEKTDSAYGDHLLLKAFSHTILCVCKGYCQSFWGQAGQVVCCHCPLTGGGAATVWKGGIYKWLSWAYFDLSQALGKSCTPQMMYLFTSLGPQLLVQDKCISERIGVVGGGFWATQSIWISYPQ